MGNMRRSPDGVRTAGCDPLQPFADVVGDADVAASGLAPTGKRRLVTAHPHISHS
jgi:hypothetical protein